MAYKSKNGMPSYKIKALAYVMTKEFGGKQTDAAEFFGVSNGTISNWVKETGYKVQIGQLERELSQSRKELESYKQLPPPDTYWDEEDE